MKSPLEANHPSNQSTFLEANHPSNQSTFDVRDQELQKPTVFRASFNRFEHITLSQAWSLWFTGCRTDGLFGVGAIAGWVLTGSLFMMLPVLVALRQLPAQLP